jgi:hypothetical protein
MDDAHLPRSHLFTIRLWLEPLGHRQHEVRSRVQHILSGETRHFRRLSDLVEWLARYCYEVEQEDEM